MITQDDENDSLVTGRYTTDIVTCKRRNNKQTKRDPHYRTMKKLAGVLIRLTGVIAIISTGLARGEINKPIGEWLCDYCSMGINWVSPRRPLIL